MNDLITLKIFDNSMDAHLLKTRLEDAEIPVALFDETFITMDPILSNALGGIKLKIKEEDAERALDILKEIENAPVINEEDQVVTCPNCNSDKLMTGFKSFKGWKGIVSMLSSLMFMVLPIHHNTEYKCKSCGYQFKPQYEE